MYLLLHKLFYNISPKLIRRIASSLRRSYLISNYNKGKRPFNRGETSKAKPRREQEMFFEKYCIGKGLDIGFGGDLIVPTTDGYDFEHGDAQYMKSIPDNKYDFVYSSHTLEHMNDAAVALRNWYRVVKKNGYLILYIPHRDLYEKKKTLPSFFNEDHKHFFLLNDDEDPDTLGILPLVARTLCNYEIIYAKECSRGYTVTEPNVHSDGEYSIEVVIKKNEKSETIGSNN
ncbi:MAG: class I SAM-dependent methyltransferase [Ignavibacteriaceae bacterium]|nr:class I SAM-dependent methyltransferase [Ignavibacteriaceae bacterium]